MDAEPKKRGPGRPKGSRNKPALEREPMPADLLNGGAHASPPDLIARNFVIIEWQQAALRRQLQQRMEEKNPRVNTEDTKAIVDLSNALVRSVTALQKVTDVAEELQKQLTPKQLLEAALKRIEGSDKATIDYAIKRLKACRTMISGGAPAPMGETATEALASLGDDD